MPCPGHDGGACTYEFDYDDLRRAIERPRPRATIECHKAFEDVPVAELLFGLHVGTQGDVLERIDELEGQIRRLAAAASDERKELLSRIGDLLELSQREFTKLFTALQEDVDCACPNVFTLVPREAGAWRRKIAGQPAELRLWCQEPGCWHLVPGGIYPFTIPADWLRTVGPYLARLVGLLKYVAPVAVPAAGIAAGDCAGLVKHHLEMMKGLVEMLPDPAERPEDRAAGAPGLREEPTRAYGEAFRALRGLLDRLDPPRRWGGLQKVLTPEGHRLWLCDHHAAQYRR